MIAAGGWHLAASKTKKIFTSRQLPVAGHEMANYTNEHIGQ